MADSYDYEGITWTGAKTVAAAETASGCTVTTTAGKLTLKGKAYDTDVTGGGKIYVYGGAIADGTTVDGGSAFIYNKGKATGTILEAGVVRVSSGGTATDTTVNNGTLYVSNGGLVDGNTQIAGNVFVYTGGQMTGATVNAGGVARVTGTATDTTVNNGGALHISDGGYIDGSTKIAGNVYVSNGGQMAGATVNAGGAVYVKDGGTATDTTIQTGGTVNLYQGGSIDGNTQIAGDLYLENGAQLAGATVNDGGTVYVKTGATATDTTITAGGTLRLMGGTLAGNTKIGGNLYLYNGVQMAGATVNAGGVLYVVDGATATDITIEASGAAQLYAGGTLNGSNVIGGELYVNGGTLNGSFDLSYGYAFVKGAADLVFDVANDMDGTAAFIGHANKIVNSGADLNFTIIVDTAQEGKYKLATYAAGSMLDGATITVKTVGGITLGTFTDTIKSFEYKSDPTKEHGIIYSINALSSTSKHLTLTIENGDVINSTNGYTLLDDIDKNPGKINVALVNDTTDPDNPSTDTVDTAVSFKGIITTINEGTFNGRVNGGFAAAGTTSGNYNMTIKGGSFVSIVNGGDRLAASGTASHSGIINLTIEGGSFAMAVAGGMMHDNRFDEATVSQTNDIYLTIKGGTFSAQVVGGNISAKTAASTAEQSVINGSVNTTLDCSLTALSFDKSVFGGSWGKGTITGDVNMTLTGKKGITIRDDLWGGCSKDAYENATATAGTRNFQTNIGGSRTLTFSGFSSTLTCDAIGGFDTLVTTGASKVTIAQNDDASGYLALGDIENWDIGYASQLKGTFGNNFTNDTMTLGSASDINRMSVDGTWIMFNSTNKNSKAFVGFSGMSSVSIFGLTASYDRSTKAWVATDSNHQFSLSTSNQYMTLTRLA